MDALVSRCIDASSSAAKPRVEAAEGAAGPAAAAGPTPEPITRPAAGPASSPGPAQSSAAADGSDRSQKDSKAFEMVTLVPVSIVTGSESAPATEPKQSSPQDSKRHPAKQPAQDQTSDLSNIETIIQSVSELNQLRGPSVAPSWKLLLRVVENVYSSPNNPRFRRIPLGTKVSERLALLDGATDLCSALGFQRIEATEPGMKPFLLLSEPNQTVLGTALPLLRRALRMCSRPNPGDKRPADKAGQGIYSRQIRPSRSGKRKADSSTTRRAPPPTRISRERMAELVSQRLSGGGSAAAPGAAGGSKNPGGSPGVTRGRIADLNKIRNVKAQIREIRAAKNRQWRNTRAGRKRFLTIRDLEGMAESRQKAVTNFGNKMELDKVGKQALEFTNQFRKKHGKPPLQWHQALCDIGRVHSKDMGDGKVGFSHVGFKKRVQQYPMSHRAAAENLAMNSGVPESQVARVAVDGWIDSPGHRKNLLSNQTYCGIGVYRNARGQYYLTQLFALT